MEQYLNLVQQAKLSPPRKISIKDLPFDWNNTAASPQQQEQILETFTDLADVFAQHNFDLGRMLDYYFQIDTGDKEPIELRPYHHPFHKKEIVTDLISQLLEQGVIEPSESEWASLIVMVDKKDGYWQLCVDF